MGIVKNTRWCPTNRVVWVALTRWVGTGQVKIHLYVIKKMKQRDYYFIAGGVFLFICLVFLLAYIYHINAKSQANFAQAIEMAHQVQPSNLAHMAVTQPETGFIGGASN